jgi:hypothetical protein
MAAGDADWRKLVKDAVAVKAATSSQKSGASDHIRISRVGLSTDAHPFLVEAARKRGISLTGYIRRATMAHVAMDLGLEAVDLFDKDLSIAPIGRRGGPPTKDLDGERYGRWEVQPHDVGDDA